MQNRILLFLILGLLGCEKTPLNTLESNLEGVWSHHTAEKDLEIITINEIGNGTIEWIVDDKPVKKTKVREWYLDDDILRFGKSGLNGEKYTIDKYPKITWDELVKYYDTIPEGGMYMILDDKYYVRD